MKINIKIRLHSKRLRIFFGGFFVLINQDFLDTLATGHHIGILFPQRIKGDGIKLRGVEWRKIKSSG